jgi:hypothetical protein
VPESFVPGAFSLVARGYRWRGSASSRSPTLGVAGSRESDAYECSGRLAADQAAFLIPLLVRYPQTLLPESGDLVSFLKFPSHTPVAGKQTAPLVLLVVARRATCRTWLLVIHALGEEAGFSALHRRKA